MTAQWATDMRKDSPAQWGLLTPAIHNRRFHQRLTIAMGSRVDVTSVIGGESHRWKGLQFEYLPLNGFTSQPREGGTQTEKVRGLRALSEE